MSLIVTRSSREDGGAVHTAVHEQAPAAFLDMAAEAVSAANGHSGYVEKPAALEAVTTADGRSLWVDPRA